MVWFWLSVLMLLATFVLHIGLVNPVARLRLQRGKDMIVFRILLASFAVQLAIGIPVFLLVSPGISVSVISTDGLALALCDYFLLQRFTRATKRTGMTRNEPWLLPVVIFVFFVSSALSFGLFVAWYCIAIPVLVWIGTGYISAEIAIRAEWKYQY